MQPVTLQLDLSPCMTWKSKWHYACAATVSLHAMTRIRYIIASKQCYSLNPKRSLCLSPPVHAKLWQNTHNAPAVTSRHSYIFIGPFPGAGAHFPFSYFPGQILCVRKCNTSGTKNAPLRSTYIEILAGFLIIQNGKARSRLAWAEHRHWCRGRHAWCSLPRGVAILYLIQVEAAFASSEPATHRPVLYERTNRAIGLPVSEVM